MVENSSLPFVSVIIPAFNEERFIQQCLESVLAQDWPQDKIEILVVDNGSTDGTAKIAEKLLGESALGRVLQKTDGTIASVRNFGWQHAKGELLAFLDGDSVVELSWLRIGYDFLQSSKEVSCVGFSAEGPDSSASWVEHAWHPISSSGKHKGTKEVLWLSSFNLILKRNYFGKINGFDEKLVTCEDADLGSRLSSFSKLILSDTCKVKHLDSVKTLREFFVKERWRGKSNLKSFFRNKNKSKDIFSIAAPLVYLFLVVFFLISLVASFIFQIEKYIPLTCFSLLVSFPFLLSLRAGVSEIKIIFHTSFLYMIYLIARGTSIVYGNG